MTQVDPFVYPIPKRFQDDPEVRAYFEYFSRWAHDMWLRTGGSSDNISDGDTAELFPWQLSNPDEDCRNIQFNATSKYERPFFSVSANHTCYGPEDIEATSNITITLNQEPEDNEIITVKRNTTAGNVIVDGGTINIDGATTYTMALNYESVHFRYSATSGIYLIV